MGSSASTSSEVKHVDKLKSVDKENQNKMDGNHNGSKHEPSMKRKENNSEITKIMDFYERNILILQDEIRKKKENGVYSERFRNAMSEMNEFYYPEDDYNLRRHIGERLATSGSGIIFCDLVIDLLGTKELKDLNQSDLDLLLSAVGMLDDFTDLVPHYCYIVAGHTKLLQILGENLSKTPCLTSEKAIEFNYRSITTIHNVAVIPENTSKLRYLKFVDVLEQYLEYPNEEVRFVAIATLADIVDEEESELLNKGHHIFEFFVEVFRKALASSNRHYITWSAWELAATTGKLAKNDANKQTLVEHGCLPLLVQLAKSTDQREQTEAVEALLTLSFNQENKKTMVSDSSLGLIEVFSSCRKSPIKEVRKACTYALWVLREELDSSGRYPKLVQELHELFGDKKDEEKPTKLGGKGEVKRGHVMLSYQWGNQNLVKRVRDHLQKSGYRVWMDIDDMAGSTLQAMANAVEDAEIVVVCFSKKYKDSDNCRAEAEYAYQKKKTIIPLKMERGYKPDGWLGIIIGSKLYHDFGGKYSVDSRLDGFVKDLATKYNDMGITVDPKPLTTSATKQTVKHANEDSTQSAIVEWSHDQVLKWLVKYDLDKTQFGQLNGKILTYLKYLYEKAPDSYSKALKNDLGIQDLSTKALFTHALQHL